MTTKRPYRLGRRADRQAATRRRIVEAAVDLHSTVGPASTSISAVAHRAGVQRHTVYAHFPDEKALFTACTAHWQALHPFPDHGAWAAIADPRRRLRRALDDVYDWYTEVEHAFALFRRDAHRFPPFWETWHEQLAQIAETLARGLPRRKTVRAAIGHTLAFETWRSLVRSEGLTQRAAIELIARFVEGTG
jgi:AcrR family transcriptional regulator